MNDSTSTELCPHCGASAPARASDRYRFECSECGRPRLGPDSNAPGAVQLGALRASAVAWHAADVWRTLAIVVAAFSGMSLAVLSFVVTVGKPGTTAVVASFLANSIPVVFAAFCAFRSRVLARRGQDQLDAAWRAAAA